MPASQQVRRWRNRFLAGAAASGLLWGAAGSFLFPEHSLPHQVFVSFVVAGMIAGAVGTLSAVTWAFALFAVPALLPIVVQFLLHAGELGFSDELHGGALRPGDGRGGAPRQPDDPREPRAQPAQRRAGRGPDGGQRARRAAQPRAARRDRRAPRHGERAARERAHPGGGPAHGPAGQLDLRHRHAPRAVVGRDLPHLRRRAGQPGAVLLAAAHAPAQRGPPSRVQPAQARDGCGRALRYRAARGHARGRAALGACPRRARARCVRTRGAAARHRARYQRTQAPGAAARKRAPGAAGDGRGRRLELALEQICRLVEEQYPSALCSVLLLDADGQHLRHGAAPGLPEAFRRAADGIPVGPRAGSCGTAAYHNRQVIVSDIATDELWTEAPRAGPGARLARLLVDADSGHRAGCPGDVRGVLPHSPLAYAGRGRPDRACNRHRPHCHRAQRSRAPHPAARPLRRADRAAQPAAVQPGSRGCIARDCALGAAPRPSVRGRGPLQERQRHAGPRHRRPLAQGGGGAPAALPARGRRAGALRRRRVRGAVAGPALRGLCRRRGRTAARRAHRSIAAGRPGVPCHRQHRSGHLPAGWTRRADAAEARRHRAAPGQGSGPQQLLPLLTPGRRALPRAPHPGGASAACAGARRARPALPAEAGDCRRRDHRHGGAAALASRRAGHGGPGALHPDRRGDRLDRADRRVGAAHGVRSRSCIAAGTPGSSVRAWR